MNSARPVDHKDTSRSIADARLRFLRDYARTRLDVADSDAQARISPALVLDFGAQGLFGPHLPREVGGLGLTMGDTLRLIEQAAAIDVTLAAFLVGHYTSTLPILACAGAGLREEWLPLLAQGRQFASFALTEPGAGSNPRAMATTATDCGPLRWSLRGRKSYVGTAAWAGILITFARHRGGEHQGISASAAANTRGSRPSRCRATRAACISAQRPAPWVSGP